ncbi:ragulator complex protein LAMTOR4 homolog [Paramacrobiotus metropolitanus]|uniref:ragulator complex protein LAMTOR4 homolog n=1 Tax=Paramacrobiotus metropolitanus TaxID=2943436 RepID=UPI002445F2C3|nr:ragulator complex protein LAMTOR4 homolog [Paramacrobiotus metropolitanus]
MSAQILGIDRMTGVTGHLVLNEDGAVISSAGELRNNEALSDPVLGILRAIQKGKNSLCKDEEFQSVQVYSDNAIFLVFRQAQKICIVKKRFEMEPLIALH